MDAATRIARLHQGEADQGGEADGQRHAGDDAEHALDAAGHRARRRRLHHQERGERRDERGRVVQPERLRHQEGRHRRTGEPGGPEDGGPAAAADALPRRDELSIST